MNAERHDELLRLADKVEKFGQDIECPFCGDGDFDLPGLAGHILNYCDVHDAAFLRHCNQDVANRLREKAGEAA